MKKWNLPIALLTFLLLVGCEEKTATEESTDEPGQNLNIRISAIYEDDWIIKGQIVNDRDKLVEYEWRLFHGTDRVDTDTRLEPRFSIADRQGRCDTWSLELHIATVADGYTLAQQPEQKSVNVAALNPDGCAVRRPVATFSSAMDCRFRELSVDASRSTGDGRLEYGWTFGDGGTSTRETAKHRYADDGSFPVELTVVNDGGSDTDQETINVVGPAIARISRTIEGLCVDFDSSASLGTVSSVLWRFGDPGGNSSTSDRPTFCYGEAGTFTAKLDVTNECSTETALDTFEVE